MIRIEKIPSGPLSVNSYIVWEDTQNKCVLIDPADPKMAEEFLTEHSLTPERILLTHGHFDHILGVAALKEKYNPLVCISEFAADAFTNGVTNLGKSFRITVPVCTPDILLKDGDCFTAAGVDFRAISTPGHSAGGMCFVVEEAKTIFCGDTIFRMSAGRADFPGSSPEALYRSVTEKLFTLEGNYRLLPGHSVETQLEFERQNNPFFRPGGKLKW